MVLFVVLLLVVVVVAAGARGAAAATPSADATPAGAADPVVPSSSPSPTPPTPDLRQTPDPAAGAGPEQAADPPTASLTPPAGSSSPPPSAPPPSAPPPSAPPSPASAPPAPATPPAATPPPPSAHAEDIIRRIREFDGGAVSSSKLLSNLLDSSDQDVPWGHYDLGASVRMFEHVFAHQARLVFSVGLWVIAIASWLLDFVLGFQVGQVLMGDASGIASAYHRLLEQPDGVQLTTLMWVLAVAHAGWQLFRNRGQAAAAEMLVAVLIALIGSWMLAHGDKAGCAGLSAMADLTVGTLELTGSREAATAPAHDFCGGGQGPRSVPAAEGFEESLIETFVTEPFLLLQWGEVPTDPDCAHVARALLAAGAWGDADEPRRFMEEAGCEDLVAFNADMSPERVAGAAAYALATIAFAAAVVLTAGTLLVAQVAGALLVATMPFAVVVGIAPGTGRQLLARWAHAVLKVGVLFVGSAFFLAMLIAAVGAVTTGVGGGVFVRMIGSTIVAWALVLLRGRVFTHLRHSAHDTASRMAGPGVDVGPVGVGPGASAARAVLGAATAATYLHSGARALSAAAGGAGASGAAAGLVGSGRGARLLQANRRGGRAGAPGSSGEDP